MAYDLERLTKAAEDNDLEAQYTLGLTLLASPSAYNRSLGAAWSRKAAILGHAQAQFTLGSMLLETPQTHDEGWDWIVRAAENRCVEACNFLAREAMTGTRRRFAKWEDGLRWTKYAAEEGDVEAMYRLGAVMAAPGEDQEMEAAMSYLEKAGARGLGCDEAHHGKCAHTAAVFELGRCHWELSDPERALDCFYSAAKLGHCVAQWWVAEFLRTGFVSEEDEAMALRWYITAEEGGFADFQRDDSYFIGLRHLQGDGVPVDFEKAYLFFTRAGWRHPEALLQRARLLQDGLGVSEPQPSLAFKCLTAAAEQGHLEAIDAVTQCYLRGHGVERSHAKAMEWMLRSKKTWKASRIALVQQGTDSHPPRNLG